MNALVLVNGELYRPDILRERLRRETFDEVWGVDGGSRHADALGVRITTVIGDLDSLDEAELTALGGVEVLRFPADKNETDLELALLEAVARGAGKIVLTGMTGGRLDMTLSNLLLLAHPDLAGCRIEVWHGAQTARVLRPPGGEITGHPGDTVSLVPLAGDAGGIATEGLRYRLHDEPLSFGAARGLSNLMEAMTARVKLTQGLLLAVHTPAADDGREL
jgi:thiamine pyrophosphokinase